MAILDIKKYPDKALRKKCKEVQSIDGEIKRLLDDMAMTMHAVDGIGLAAAQVGLDMRIIVIDIGDGPMKLINPRITKKEGLSIMEEGCLSIPDVYVKVKRSARIVVSALNTDGNPELIKAEGLLAHAFGQEIDHLNGKLIIDYLPFYKRLFLRK